jgi:hypothetical protein
VVLSIGTLSHSSLLKVVEEYNNFFADQGSRMTLSPDGANLRVRKILSLFNKRWHPNDQKKVFLDVFSFEAWKRLPVQFKNKHTIKKCVTCCSEHSSLTKAFPYKQARKSYKKSIAFTDSDLSSPSKLG